MLNSAKFGLIISTNVRIYQQEDSMTNRDRIIEAYLEADAEKRLHLFLDCPSLRNEFMAIDLSENRATAKAKKNRENLPERSFPARWRAALGICCLKFRGS